MVDSIRAEIAKFYIAFFDRAPDPVGLAFWESEYIKGLEAGKSSSSVYDDIANSFAISVEAKALYPILEVTDEDEIADFITDAYLNLFGRAPDAEGLAYWIGRVQEELEAGRPVGSVLVDIQSGAQNSEAGQDLATLNNKVTVSLAYTERFEASGAEWTQEDDGAGAKIVLDDVNGTPESVTDAEGKIDGVIQDQVIVSALNGAESVADVLAVLEQYEGSAFNAASLAQFDDLAPGGGRQQAIAEAVLEHRSYFGPFATSAGIAEVVTYFTNTEFNKFEFINAVDAATNIDQMVAALRLAVDLNSDRQGLIAEWSASGSVDAQERAGVLAGDSFTIAVADIADDSSAELNFLATKMLESKAALGHPFYGVTAIIAAQQNAEATPDQIDDSAKLVIDRAAPAQYILDGNELTVKVNAEGPDSGFERYQGVAVTDNGKSFDVGHNSAFSATLRIGSDWTTDNDAQLTGVWITLQNDTGTLPGGGAFAIAEYIDADAAAIVDAQRPGDGVPDGFEGGFRFWAGNGWTEYVKFDVSGMDSVELTYVFAEDAHIWFVNGEELFRDTTTYAVLEADVIQNVIFNSQNFGVAETYNYSDISLVGVSGSGVAALDLAV